MTRPASRLPFTVVAGLVLASACGDEHTVAQSAGGSVTSASCEAFIVTGDPGSANGANWSYASTDDGIVYSLTGRLFTPTGTGPFPGALVSHGMGGNAAGYSANVARVMRNWGMAVIATNYTHAGGGMGIGFPDGDFGASEANVLRASKARNLLGCLGFVDMQRLAAHGHSMGAFVTGQLVGTHPDSFRAASHSAGGANESGPNATRPAVADNIRTPYLLHHGDSDVVVHIGLDQELARILASNGVPHDLVTWPGYTHEQIALDAGMLEQVRAWYMLHGVL